MAIFIPVRIRTHSVSSADTFRKSRNPEKKYKSFKTGIAIIKTIHNLYNRQFKWKEPPYEYEETKMPIDILSGTGRIRNGIEEGTSVNHMEDWWKEECLEFDKKVSKKYLMYK